MIKSTTITYVMNHIRCVKMIKKDLGYNDGCVILNARYKIFFFILLSWIRFESQFNSCSTIKKYIKTSWISEGDDE